MRLTNLDWLELTNSKITSIPASIGRLALLESLDLQHNVIESLGPFAKGAACPDNTKKEGSKDAICDDYGCDDRLTCDDYGCVRLAGNHGVCKRNATLNGTSVTTYLDGYDSNEVRLHFINLCSNSNSSLHSTVLCPHETVGPNCGHLLTPFSHYHHR